LAFRNPLQRSSLEPGSCHPPESLDLRLRHLITRLEGVSREEKVVVDTGLLAPPNELDDLRDPPPDRDP
jgi:hypothetical protein